ncbi:hypothetical protein NIES22_11130 [Calothrix brevissima NIES-22]|nr:hypothetical protein NIES22_11130 [Calothrix brevissima NIES-22]
MNILKLFMSISKLPKQSKNITQKLIQILVIWLKILLLTIITPITQFSRLKVITKSQKISLYLLCKFFHFHSSKKKINIWFLRISRYYFNPVFGLIKWLRTLRLLRLFFSGFLSFLLVLNMASFDNPIFAEGSYQFGPDPSQVTLSNQGLMEYDSPYSDAGGTTTGIGQLNRPIYVDIVAAGEVINIGACGSTFGDNWEVDIYYNGTMPDDYSGTYAAYPPASGTLVFGQAGDAVATNSNFRGQGTFGTSANNANCTTYAQLSTANMDVSPAGTGIYVANDVDHSSDGSVVRYITTQPGVYEIRLRNRDQNTNAADPNTIFRQFDISITPNILTNPNPQSSNGRVWSYVWAFNAKGFGNYTNQDFYVVVPGGTPGTNFIWKLDLNYFAGYIYELVANNAGVNSPNGAGVNVRGLSVPVSGNSVTPKYRQYLSYPTARAYTRPTQAPQISNLRFEDSDGEDNTITPGFTGGIQDTGSFKFTSSLPGTYEIIIDANQNGVYGDSSGTDVQLRGDTDASGNVSAVWNGKNNLGTVLPVGNYNAQIKAIVGEYHFIAADIETSGGSQQGLTVVEATGASTTTNTQVYWDDKTALTTGYNAGTGTTTLPNGSIGGRHTWGTTSTGGAQGSNGSSWGDVRYIDTFVYGSFTVGVIPAIIADVDQLDWGDAPDTYGTNKTNSSGEGIGASQVLSTTIKLGNAVTDQDPQPFTYGTTVANGQPNAAANGDDINATDDEDGVTSFPNLSVSDANYTVPVRVQNTSGANAYLGGWIDFNRDGKFSASEGVVQTIATGTNGNFNLTWSGLTGLVAGDTYARFRINSDPVATTNFIGGMRNGEVEDYLLTISGPSSTYDYGDAPDTATGTGTGNYNTTNTDSGPRHLINSNLKLGSNAPDADSGTLQNSNASADDTNNIDDEDGVTLLNTINAISTTYSATVNVTNITGTPASLVGWVDFNKNGVFEATEGVSQTIADNTNNSNVVLNWTGLSGLTPGTTYARFRISNGTLTTATPTGLIGIGEVEDYQVTINTIDYGDAPDTTAGTGANDYQTTAANSGASHLIINTLKIGANEPDADNGTLQNANADADDITNIDDEDGVTFPTTLSTTNTTYSATVTITNISGSAATLVGWIDFNKNGVFDPSEGVSQSVPNNASPQNVTLNWTSLTGLTVGNTYARFRLSDSASLTTSTPNGAIGNGEVEDYLVVISNSDYGDAPDTGTGTGVGNYQTTSSDGGPSHTILNTLKLGTNAPDADSGTLQNSNAEADDTNNIDDEDGVASFPSLTTSSTSYSVTVNVLNNTSSARPLVGWIDFNKDGVFAASEGVSQSVPNNASSQNITLTWTGLSGLTTGTTYARFRISDGALTTSTPNGAVGNGEVEDYQLSIQVSNPNVLLVKRITEINNATTTNGGDNLAAYINQASNPYDDNTLDNPAPPAKTDTDKWPAPNTFLIGGVNGGKIIPGDVIEYTIYFLSAGNVTAKNALFCDLVPANTTFNSTAFNTGVTPDPSGSGDRGIAINLNGSVKAYSNADDGDIAQYFLPGVEPTTKYPKIDCDGDPNTTIPNTNGAVVVNLGDVPNATASGTPTNSYGFVRFRAQVK